MREFVFGAAIAAAALASLAVSGCSSTANFLFSATTASPIPALPRAPFPALPTIPQGMTCARELKCRIYTATFGLDGGKRFTLPGHEVLTAVYLFASSPGALEIAGVPCASPTIPVTRLGQLLVIDHHRIAMNTMGCVKDFGQGFVNSVMLSPDSVGSISANRRWITISAGTKSITFSRS